MVTLYDDQKAMIERVTASLKRGHKSVLMQYPTGGGKSVMATEIVHRAVSKGNSVWFTVPRRELIRQMSATFSDFGVRHSYIAAGSAYSAGPLAHICSTDTVKGRTDRLVAPKLAVIDECFPTGTRISTPNGEKDIAEMSLGDVIYCATGIGEVVAKSSRLVQKIYTVRLNDGTTIKTTQKHPFLSKRGWVRCEQLVKGDELFSIQDMPRLWRSLSTKKKEKNGQKDKKDSGVPPIYKRIYKKEVLLNKLLEEDRELHESAGCEGKSKQEIKRNRAQAICAWWERQGVHTTARNDFGDVGCGLDSRNGNTNKRTKMGKSLSNMLQGRCGKLELNGCDRSGWTITQCNETERKRQKEGRFFNIKRVESVEVEELSCGEIVYNMEVYGHPSFFANGILVHNCHFGGDGLDRLIKWLKANGTIILGLSATPWKLSGEGLGKWYDDMVQGPSVRQLIDAGRLSEYDAFAPSTPDLSGIKIAAGDYAKGQLAERMEQDRVLIGNAVKHYKTHAEGKLNIAYCVSIAHSEIVAQSFRDAGITAAHIDGKTPDIERKRIIKAYAKREIMVLTNCELLTFGFDLASQVGMDVTVECMSDLRPTKSLALQAQKWGRVLRRKPYPAIIFDHANNFMQHGLPCDEREWTLDDRLHGVGTKGGERILPVKQCLSDANGAGCFHCHHPSPKCPKCGHVYEVQSREIEEVEGELEAIDKERIKKMARMEVGKAKTIADLERIRAERGYAPGWVYQIARVKGIRG